MFLKTHEYLAVCLSHFLNLVLFHCSVMYISAVLFEKRFEMSVGLEQSGMPDIDSGEVIFATVLILLSLIHVEALQNLWATAVRSAPSWMATP